MRKSSVDENAGGKATAGERVRYFFSETFRPHSREEYAEVFMCGLQSGGAEQSYKKLPWLYIRIFALNVILFASLVLARRLTGYAASYVTAILFGGLLFNVPLLVFFYELYPKRDFSLLKLFTVLLIGGAVSTVLALFGYEYIYSAPLGESVWISTLWIGFWEELVKGAVAICAILLLKQKNPFVCFLTGFAVGTGFSFLEDMAYIFNLSRSGGTLWLVLTSVGRGLSCVCSHAPWTGIVCWAFAKAKKPFLSPMFYGTCITSMVLHYFADVPFFDDNLNILRGITVGWAIEAVVVGAIFVITFFMLKSSFKDFNGESPQAFQPAPTLTESLKFSKTANLSAVLCAILISGCALTGCAIDAGETQVYEKFADEKAFVSYVQNGREFNADFGRKYDKNSGNYSQFTVDGEIKCAVQTVEEGDCNYYYIYEIDGERSSLVSIGVKYAEEEPICYCSLFVIFANGYNTVYGSPPNYFPIDGTAEIIEDDVEISGPEQLEKVVRFFNLDGRICKYDLKDRIYSVESDETEFKNASAVIALGAVSAAAFIGGLAVNIIFQTKKRRIKND